MIYLQRDTTREGRVYTMYHHLMRKTTAAVIWETHQEPPPLARDPKRNAQATDWTLNATTWTRHRKAKKKKWLFATVVYSENIYRKEISKESSVLYRRKFDTDSKRCQTLYPGHCYSIYTLIYSFIFAFPLFIFYDKRKEEQQKCVHLIAR